MDFTHEAAWSGGYYELAIVLGPADDDRHSRALEALWSFPDLDGCYLVRDVEPADQRRVAPSTEQDKLYGLARLAREPIPCRSLAMRFVDRNEDWLSFEIAMGALARILPVGAFPFADGGDLAWRTDLDAWFVRLAHHVYAATDFRVALVGWTDACELDDAEHFVRAGVPAVRWVGFVEPRGGTLAYHPPNRGAQF